MVMVSCTRTKRFNITNILNEFVALRRTKHLKSCFFVYSKLYKILQMKRILVAFGISAVTIFFFSACQKVEGQGGSSSIIGKITVNNYNVGGSILEGVYPGSDEKVYICYGEGNTIPSDDVNASYDGTFEFKYLQPGKYTLYVYEDVLPEPANADQQKAVIVSVEITGKKSTVDAGEIVIKKK